MVEAPLVRAQHYRDLAAKLRAIADEESDAKRKADLRALAEQYEGLSDALLQQAAAASSRKNGVEVGPMPTKEPSLS